MLPEKPWRAEAVIQFCMAQMVCLCLGVIAVSLLQKQGIRGFQREESLGCIMIGTLAMQGAAWPLIWIFLWRHGMGWRAAFGFYGPALGRALLMAAGFIAVVLPLVLWLQYISIHLMDTLNLTPENQAPVKLLAHAESKWTTVYLGVFAIVLVPVAEEFIFRGMLFPFVRQFRCPSLTQFIRRRGFPKLAWCARRCLWRFLAWFGVSFLFALIHTNIPTFVPLFVFALALTWLYEKTDNLLAPITAHALFNAVNFVVLLWQIHHPEA
ncbi:MAG: CPBP family intramembrane glutamic endopeptidase [Limisphaerales bacterium]